MKVLMTLIAVLLTLMLPAQAEAQTTQFTYQGELTDSGASQATYQMRFRLFDALASGNQIGDAIENASVAVGGGVFTVSGYGANAEQIAARIDVVSSVHVSVRTFWSFDDNSGVASDFFLIVY